MKRRSKTRPLVALVIASSGRQRARHGEIALAAELERLELELDLLAMLLPGAELDLSQIEAPHGAQGTAVRQPL